MLTKVELGATQNFFGEGYEATATYDADLERLKASLVSALQTEFPEAEVEVELEDIDLTWNAPAVWPKSREDSCSSS